MNEYSIHSFSREFGISRDIIRDRLSAAGHKLTGDKGQRWTGRQIMDAVMCTGGLEAAREAMEWERHRELKMANEKTDGSHWDKQECLDLIGSILQAVRSRITSLPTTQASSVNPTDPESGYNALQAWVDSVMPLIRSDIKALSEEQQKETEVDEL